MDLHELYKQSDIFASIENAIKGNSNVDSGELFTSLTYLNSKSTVFNLLNDSDLYLIINFQNGGEIVFEKNMNLQIGNIRLTLSKIMDLVDLKSLSVDAKIDKAFIEYHLNNKVEPLDLILTSKSFLTYKESHTIYIQRTIAILSNDNNGIPHFGFSCVNEVEKSEFDFGNFQLRSSSNDSERVNDLASHIQSSLK